MTLSSHLPSFRNAAIGATAAAFLGVSALVPFSAAAQQALSKAQCFQAMAVVSSLMKEYQGKVSDEFHTSLKTFVARDCDMNTEFKVMPGTQDKDVFGKFRVMIVAIRTAQAGKPTVAALR